MRATFKLNTSRGLVSAIRSKGEPHTLKVGVGIVLTKPFLAQHGLIPAGSKGWIESVAADDGTLWIFMEGSIPALAYWDNRLVLSPFETEDLAACIEVWGNPIFSSRTKKRIAMAAALIAAVSIGCVGRCPPATAMRAAHGVAVSIEMITGLDIIDD